MKHHLEIKNMIKQYIKHIIILFTLIISLTVTAQAQQGGDYNSKIKSADEYYQNKDYYNAKAAYQLASQMQPDEAYPKEKIAEIINLLKAEMQVRGEYDEYIELADEAFDAKDYSLAITNYEKALNLIAYEEHPKQQLAKAKNLLQSAQQKESKYNAAISTADKYFANQEYQEALSSYREAANIDTDQKYPNDQILKINNILQNQNSNQLAYEQAISQADQQLNYQKFSEALSQYEKALSIKPNDSYAQTQVTKMEGFIEKEKEYDKIAAQADELYVKKDFIAAKTMYAKAQKVLPEKTYALNMIDKIDASLNAEQKKLAKAEADYQKAISDADALFKQQKYQVAYSKYSKALDMKPNEEYPKNQLLEIDILLATGYLELSCFVHENNKGLFDSRIQLKEGGRVIETDEIGTNGRQKLKLELNKEYQIRFYKADYIQKIFDINTALPKTVNHNNIFEYDLSVELFQTCSTDLSILDSPLTEIKYQESKGNFYYDEDRARVIISKVTALKQECKEILEKEAQKSDYDQAITKADKYFTQENYSKALENYTIASSILPTVEYPQQRITEINSILESAGKYQALIISGDAKYKAKDYENALYDYYEAKNLKPNETYPPEKIAEIDIIINAQKEIDANYLAEISTADSLYQMDSLSMAVVSYRAASKIKVNESYPKDQIAKIEQELKSREELDMRYQDAIDNADNLFEAEKLNDAKAAYLIASQIKPNEMYPKYKIEDINTIEEQRKIMALNDNYAQVLSEADGLFEKLNYQDALPLYIRAAEIKPKEDYPPAQIKKINVLLAQIEADNNQYQSLIISADKKFDVKEYALSFDDYKLATQLKPEEQYPKDRMAEIEAIMKELSDLETAYQEAIHQADTQFDSKLWAAALPFYQKANTLKPAENYPIEKIAEINSLLKDMADKDASYDAAIAEADRRYDATEWSLALSSYQSALSIKPNEEYPQTRITELEGKLKDLQDKQAAYDAAIASADELFNSRTYTESKSYYQQALSIKAEEEYPKQRISEIEAILLQMAESDALYDQLIADGDDFFTQESYQQSMDQFKQAAQMKPNETYPPQKIQEIETILMAIAKKDRLYTEAIKEADRNRDIKAYPLALEKYTEALAIKPDEQYPIEQIGLIQVLLEGFAQQQQAYEKLIADADAKFDQKSWNDALSLYKQALGINVEEVYPQTQIQEIEKILQKIAETNAAYDKAIADADAAFEAKIWETSLMHYQLASQIKPEEAYPKEKISELNSIMGDIASIKAKYDAFIADADLLFANENYTDSRGKYQLALELKKLEEYPRKRIDEIDALIAQMALELELFNQAVEQADRLFAKEEWDASMLKYQEALVLKPKEIYPQVQINIINEKLQEIRGQLMAYESLISEADEFFNSREYDQSLLKYEAALQILPEEKYPKERMKEIRDLMVEQGKNNAEYDKIIVEADSYFAQEKYDKAKKQYILALNIFTDRPYPQEQIKKIDELVLKLEEYSQLIITADAAFKEKAYEEALPVYKQALAVLPTKEYPQKKITEIETILSAIAMTQAAYDEAIRKGDMRFEAKEYELAKQNYNEASNQISTEVYPRQKIMEIDQILQDLARKRMQFDKMIAQANAAFDKESYDMALSKYTSALEIIPEEEYPKQKIEEINTILSQIADKQTRYDNLVEQGDQAFDSKDYTLCISLFEQALTLMPQETYPPQKIAEAKKQLKLMQDEIDIRYAKAIAEADKMFKRRDWDPAKEAYQNASDIKPTELYPKEQLAKINSIFEEELKKQQKEYDRYIADGERLYGTKYYQEAIISFEKALTVFPYEKYPVEMIDKIFELIKKSSIVSILDRKVQIADRKTEKFKFEPIAYRDRKDNYVLLEIKVIDPEKNVKLFLDFGTANSKLGGYSIHLKNKDKYQRYFVNIGRQPRWVESNNDYISLYPEGGSIEVKLIKIGRDGI
jgi:tetratricopeptide (TPR) repeat protein